MTIKQYLYSFLKAQLVVLCTSLPILVSWGIPVSLMTVVGNFIFSPFLTVFLVISALIFTTELLYIPNSFLITLLTQTVTIWERLLELGKKSWLIGFAQPDKAGIVLLVILGALLIFRFVFRVLSKVIIIAIAVLAVTFAHHRYNRWPKEIVTNAVPYTHKKLEISQHPNRTITICDKGLFNQKVSPETFISFELKPYVIKKYGTTKIDKITINRPSSRSLRATKKLCDECDVKAVEVAYFRKPLSRYGWRTFFALKQKCEAEGISFRRA